MNRFVRLEELLVRQGVLAIAFLLPCGIGKLGSTGAGCSDTARA